MVDLVSQLEKIKPSIDKVLNEVLSTAQFINGPEVKAFQSELQEYLGVKHVIPCANGTDALQIALMSLGCLLYTSPSPRDLSTSRMPSSA